MLLKPKLFSSKPRSPLSILPSPFRSPSSYDGLSMPPKLLSNSPRSDELMVPSKLTSPVTNVRSSTLNGFAGTLIFHYDPETGNVSFDTSETRQGSLILYQLEMGYRSNNGVINPTGILFRPENHVRLGQLISNREKLKLAPRLFPNHGLVFSH